MTCIETKSPSQVIAELSASQIKRLFESNFFGPEQWELNMGPIIWSAVKDQAQNAGPMFIDPSVLQQTDPFDKEGRAICQTHFAFWHPNWSFGDWGQRFFSMDSRNPRFYHNPNCQLSCMPCTKVSSSAGWRVVRINPVQMLSNNSDDGTDRKVLPVSKQISYVVTPQVWASISDLCAMVILYYLLNKSYPFIGRVVSCDLLPLNCWPKWYKKFRGYAKDHRLVLQLDNYYGLFPRLEGFDDFDPRDHIAVGLDINPIPRHTIHFPAS